MVVCVGLENLDSEPAPVDAARIEGHRGEELSVSLGFPCVPRKSRHHHDVKVPD
jgi:hypothetical protein